MDKSLLGAFRYNYLGLQLERMIGWLARALDREGCGWNPKVIVSINIGKPALRQFSGRNPFTTDFRVRNFGSGHQK